MTERITAPGIYADIPAATYCADPCQVPSLSSGIAGTLVSRSPRHARHEHPRVNPAHRQREPTAAMEEGTALHAMLLGTPQEIVAVDAADWRTKKAQECGADVRARGGIPVLAHRLDELRECTAAVREQLAEHDEWPDALETGRPEVTLAWREGEAWCRARVDWLPDDRRRPLFDLKSTSGSAAPDTWERKLRDDYAMQAAFYCRGARALGLRPPAMVFLVFESVPPYGLCLFQPDPTLVYVAEQRVAEAIALWRECMKSGRWPGYPRRVCHVEAPGWMLMQQEERAMRAQQARHPGPSVLDRFIPSYATETTS